MYRDQKLILRCMAVRFVLNSGRCRSEEWLASIERGSAFHPARCLGRRRIGLGMTTTCLAEWWMGGRHADLVVWTARCAKRRLVGEAGRVE